VVELVGRQAAFEVGPRVHAWCGVTLDVDVVAGEPVVLPPEEVVEAHLVEGGGGRERGEVAADPFVVLVGLHHHHRRVPADEGPDPAFQVLVTGEPRLLVGGDGVDVGGAHLRRDAHLQLARPFEEPGDEEAGAGAVAPGDHGIE